MDKAGTLSKKNIKHFYIYFKTGISEITYIYPRLVFYIYLEKICLARNIR